ncbi:MAG: caspase family protein, partial [Hyphomicrobiales bacterium]
TVLKRDLDVEDEAISLDRVVRTLEPAKRLRLIILDACRDNPFVRTVRRTVETRSIGRGLARIEPPSSDTLIAFAAKAGSTASDGDEQHSPFTTALLQNLTTPGLDLRLALGRVRDDVIRTTRNGQEPFVYGSLGGATVSLVPEMSTPAAAMPPAAPAFDAKADARRDYELAAQVGTKETWDSFLSIHSTGFYADIAKGQRAKLLADEARTSRSAPPVASPGNPQPQASPAPPTVVAVAPTNTPTPAKPESVKPDIAETARQLHTELQRLGCYPGAIDASWGGDSRRALEQFNKYAKARLDTRTASLDALGVVRGRTGRICPMECQSGYRAENDACVKIACRSGYILDNDGDCVREKEKSKSASRPEPRDAKPAPPREPKPAASRKSDGAPAQVVCGMNGCLNVGRGCRGERRAAGNGEVAVVICGQ